MKKLFLFIVLVCTCVCGTYAHEVYGAPIDVTALSVGEAVTCYVHAGGAANGWLNTKDNNPANSVQEQSAEYMYTVTKTAENTYQVMLKNTYWVCFKNTSSTGGWSNATGTNDLYEFDLVFEAAENPTNVLDYGKNAFIIKGKTSGLHNAYQSNRFSATQSLAAVPVQFYAVSNSLVGKWFRMQLRPGATENVNYPFYYNEVENKIKTRNSTDANSAIAERVFFFKKSGNWGVTLHTLAIGESKGFTVATPARVDGNDNTTGSMSETPTVFNLVANNNTNGKWALNLPRSTTSYVNDISGNLGAWNNNSARNDGGSAFTITPLTADEETLLGIWSYKVSDLVAEIETEINSTNEGTVVGKPNNAEVQKLASAKETAKNAESKTEDTYNTLLAAYNAYKASSNISLPKDGHAYVFTNIATDLSKHYLYENTTNDKVLWADRGTGSADDIPANGKYICRVNGIYFTFVNAETGHYLIWRGSDAGYNSAKGYEVNYNDEDCRLFVERPVYNSGNMGSVTSQQELFGWVCFGGKRNSYNGIDKCFLYSNGTDHFNQDTGHVQRFGGGHSSMFAIEEVTNPNTIKLTNPNKSDEIEKQTLLDKRYVGTFSAPYAVELRNGVEAYIASVTDDVVTFAKLENGNIVPKNTGVMLYAPDAQENITESAIPAITTVDMTGRNNAFVGSNAGSVVMQSGYYVLGKKEAGVGFYPAVVESTLARNKAYLDLSQHPQVSAFRFDFEGEDITTELSSVMGLNKQNDGVAYDLAGRRCNINAKGISIIGNKKVIR